MDSEDHKRYIGKPNDLILENFKKLAGRHPHITVRVPLVPGITDTEKNIKAVTEFVLSTDPNIPIELLNYNSLGNTKYERLGRVSACKDLRTLTDEAYNKLKAMVSNLGGVSV